MKINKYLKPKVMTVALSLALTSQAQSDEIKDQIIIKYKDLSSPLVLDSPAHLQQLSSLIGTSIKHQKFMYDGKQVIQLEKDFNDIEIEDMLVQLNNQPEIEFAEEDRILQTAFSPNDPLYFAQWHYFEAIGGIGLESAWDIVTGSGVTIAVLDTGYRPHVDLVGNIVGGYDMISNTFISNDGDLRDSDASDPGDWVTANQCGNGNPAQNSSWHGTHVAGTVAAVTDNGVGLAGVAFDADVVPVRVLGKCGGFTSDIADGMVWASGGTVDGVPANLNPAKVLNLSLGGSGACSATSQNAIDTAVANGSVVVVAAGNSNADVTNFNPGNCNNVISVAATDRSADRAYYSNFGNLIDIAAPGGDVTVNGGADGVASTLNSGTTTPGGDTYVYYQGTSMAAPHVAGVAGLMFEANPSLTPAQVETIIKDSSRTFPGGSTCNTSNCGDGIIDANQAVIDAANSNTPPVANDDSASTDEDNPVNNVNLTSNDTDSDGDDVEILSLDTTGTLGSVSIDNNDDTVDYDPDGQFESLGVGQSAQDTFAYTAEDGNGGNDSATVTITVNGVNDDPVAVNNNANTDEDTLVSVEVLAGDSDVDTGDSLSVTSCSGASNGTVVRVANNCEFTPAQNFNGQGSFNYAISDGNGGTDSASVTVTVNAVNDDPEAVNDNANTDEDTLISVAVLTGDSDVDTGDTLSVTSCSGASNGTVVRVANNCEFTPAQDFNGQGSFNYAISDGNGGTDSASVTVAVNPVDDAPVAVNDGFTVNEDSGLNTFAVINNDTDIDNGPLNIITVGSANNGVTAQNGNSVDYTPNDNYCGNDLFTYELNGGSEATVSISVTCVDDAPVAVNDGFTVNEDSGVNVLSVTDNDTDVDAGPLNITAVGSANNGSVVQNGNNIEYTPNDEFCGDDSFTYDLNGGTQASVDVTVNCVNDEPSMVINEAVYVALSDVANPPVQALACQFDFGPDNEDASQAVNDMLVNVTNDVDSILISVDVDNNGLLSYVFTGNAGVAEVTVILQDDGGIDHNGIDTSQTYTFTVNVHDYVFRSDFEQDVCQ